MVIQMELIKKLTEEFGVSGREDKIRELIISEIKPLCDEVTVDALGNVTGTIRGGEKIVAAAAHMDEIGVVITYKSENGFLRFAAVGGLDTRHLVGRRVVFENGTVGVIGSEKDNDKNQISKMYIDVPSECGVDVGDMACFEGEFHSFGSRVVSKALDNRLGCWILIEAMKKVKGAKNTLKFIFTAQEEVGLRGAKAAAFGCGAEAAVAVDVTDTGDTPECSPMAVSLGGGAAVKIMDRSVICHSEIRSALIKLANENNICYQLEVMTEGGTDAGSIHVSGSGIKTGGISVPVRYIHSPSEMADMKDAACCANLLAAFMDEF